MRAREAMSRSSAREGRLRKTGRAERSRLGVLAEEVAAGEARGPAGSERERSGPGADPRKGPGAGTRQSRGPAQRQHGEVRGDVRGRVRGASF